LAGSTVKIVSQISLVDRPTVNLTDRSGDSIVHSLATFAMITLDKTDRMIKEMILSILSVERRRR